MSQLVHPNILSAVVIIRTRPEHRPRSLISSLALFSVTRSGEAEARFALHHAFFDPTQTRAEIIDGLAKRLPQGSELLVWHTVSPVERLFRAHTSGDIFPSDAELVLRQRPDITLLPLHVSGAQLRKPVRPRNGPSRSWPPERVYRPNALPTSRQGRAM
ncbi:hypothetical protein J3454_15375 [Erythrobacter sp. NFXS35]|uniref:hypothetical protein n=1 Tax=Erythrobacter sp. NFXS35 TaxID=2818436 RepID=UPI0032DEA98E